MSLLPRKNIAGLEVGQHGGIDYAEMERLGLEPGAVLDFSVSVSPMGFPPGVSPVVEDSGLSTYPDSRSGGLRRVIARRVGLSSGNIVVGSGSTELIRLAVLSYLDDSDSALIMEPTYGEYRLACGITGARVVTQKLTAEDAFRPDIDATTELIKRDKPKIIFICNPNNPTGHYLELGQFRKILAAAPDSLVVLDEAYIAFVAQRWPSPELIGKGNLLVVRSMTKDYALAGLRLGYAIAGEEIIETLRRVCPPWNVNVVAQRAGMAALEQEGYLEESRELALAGKQYLMEELEKLGFRCLPSAANFFLVEAGDAAELRNRLLGKGILVRDCASFGLPEYIRIAPRTMEENRRLVAAMKEVSDEG